MPKKIDGAENPFWDFSLATYARPGVAEACVALQDRHGLDVNMLLFCCWTGSLGHGLGAGELRGLLREVRDWQLQVVAPLRSVRRWLKARDHVASALRADITSCEVKAERIEQSMLFASFPVEPGPPSPSIAVGNLRSYLRLLDLPSESLEKSYLATLLAGSFPSFGPEELDHLLD